ncbi:hypothetical protein GCM10009836_21220 [Pseudonocardia ailaonensis]|uniref:PpiC domain-containing protein n=2 Tax=Pseudonocardia ailaonensis TaxID=367279 RepID=A0ABN2MYM5_9PSEU
MIVGDRSVAIGDMQSRIDTALGHKAQLAAQSSQDIADADVSRYVVGREVMHELLTAAATREGIAIPDQAVDAALADQGTQSLQLDRSLYEGAALRDRVRDRLIAIALAGKYIDHLAVTVDLASATSQQDAEAKARTIAAGGPAAQKILSDAATAQAGMRYRAGQDPESATTVLFGTPAGQTVAFQPSPGQGVWLVLHVVERSTTAPLDGPPAAGTVDQDTLAAIGERLTQPDSASVKVNPRFGEWDPIAQQVVPAGKAAGTILGASAG